MKGGAAWISSGCPTEAGTGITSTSGDARPQPRSPAWCAEAPSAPPRGCEALGQDSDSREQLRHFLENDERGRACEWVAAVRVRVQIFRAEVPHLLELRTHEECGRERQPTAQRLANTDDVRNVGARPHLADATQAGEDRVHDEQGTCVVAPFAQPRQELVRRDARTRTPLNGLDYDDSCIFGQRARVFAIRASMHRSRQPGGERIAKAFQTRRGEGEQAGAVVRAVERDDARLAGREQRRAQCDLDRVLTRDSKLRRPRQRLTELLGDLRLRQVAERMNDRSRGDRLQHVWIPMAQRRDTEAAGQVDVLASDRVPDAAAFGPRPDQVPLRRPMSRPSVSVAM